MKKYRFLSNKQERLQSLAGTKLMTIGILYWFYQSDLEGMIAAGTEIIK